MSQQGRIGRDRRDQILAHGGEPYPVTVQRSYTFPERAAVKGDVAPDTSTGCEVQTIGRVIWQRNGGRIVAPVVR